MNPHFERLVANYPELASCVAQVEQAFDLLVTCFSQGGKLLVCGNGGSAADADHIVGELVKGFLLKRPVPASFDAEMTRLFGLDGHTIAEKLQGGLPAISLAAHTALLTAFSNDVSADLAFAQQVHVYGRRNDVLLGISTSGRSANVLHAFRVARCAGLKTIGFTGSAGGGMPQLCDALIQVPFSTTPQIQERHLPIYHALCIALEHYFFDEAAGTMRDATPRA